MLKKISIRTGLLALLAMMTLLLLVVSVMGIIAIQKGNRSLDVINRIQGIELNALYMSNGNLLRTRATAALAIRKMEVGLPDDAAKIATRSASYVVLSQHELKRFVDAGTVTEHGRILAEAVVATHQDYLANGITPMMTALQKQNVGDYYSVLEGNLSDLAGKFSRAVSAFGAYADDVSATQMAQAARNQTMMTVLILVSGALTLLLVALAWLILRILLLKPLDHAIRHLEHVADGDLTQPVPESGNNELY